MRDRPMRTPPMFRPCVRPQRPSVIAFLLRKYAVFPLSLASIQTALFDGSLAPYIPDRTCLCEGPRVAFCRLFARCDYV